MTIPVELDEQHAPEPDEAPLLRVTGLEAGYGPVQVLRGLDFWVGTDEIVVILGANGAGKTTTLRAICGMLPSRGTVILVGPTPSGAELGDNGVPPVSKPKPVNIKGKRPEQLVKMGVAHVPQGRGTITELTVNENLRIGAYGRRDKDVRADIDKWCEIFPRLGERRRQAAGSMSGGEQQMLAIARALMSRPRLVLLDEPSLGLAPLVTKELFSRLTEINQETGTAMLIVEQNANLALQIASRGYVLETGRIVAQGSATELRSNEAVRQAYLGY
jgi:branched-chain amino acid transport system ATP-binding protein